jgi:hypothetical protein
MLHLLSRATKDDLRREPFAHVVLQNALERGLYGALASSFPAQAIIEATGANGGFASNRRYSMPSLASMMREDSWPIVAPFGAARASSLTAMFGH